MARRKLNMFQYGDILDRLRRKETQRHIQKALSVSPKIIIAFRAVADLNGWTNPEAERPSDEAIEATVASSNEERRAARGTNPQVSLVEPHRPFVEECVKKGMEAYTIYQALARNHGFEGSYSSVRRFVRRCRGAIPDPVVRLQFAPGESAQVDFGSGPQLADSSGKTRKTHIFVMTLSFSRHQYAEIVWDQTVATWLRCHRNAFEFFGGVPQKVRIDNLKSAITKSCRYDPQVQRSYGEFARAYEFIIDPCEVRTPEHKGRVESGVRYVKRSFVNSPRTLCSLADANAQLKDWIMEIAGNRVHGTTHQMPLRVFAEEEKAALKPLPAERVDIAVWKTVTPHPDCHVVFEKAYYSAPHRFVGRQLDLRATSSSITMFDNAELVALHARATHPGQFKTVLDHYPPEKTAYLRQTPQWCLSEAKKVGDACVDFMEELLGDRVTDRLRAAQGLLRLRKKFGADRLEAACRRALSFDNVRYQTVKRILEKGLDQLPLDEGEGGQLDLPFPEPARFSRDIHELFSAN